MSAINLDKRIPGDYVDLIEIASCHLDLGVSEMKWVRRGTATHPEAVAGGAATLPGTDRPTWLGPNFGGLLKGCATVLRLDFDSKRNAVSHEAVAAHEYAAHLPWKVTNIKVRGNNVSVQISDETGTAGYITIPRDRLKFFQNVGEWRDATKKFFAQVRQAPKGRAFAPAHKVLYLGDMSDEEFRRLLPSLEQQELEWVWYPKPRKERLKDLLPQVASVDPVPESTKSAPAP